MFFLAPLAMMAVETAAGFGAADLASAAVAGVVIGAAVHGRSKEDAYEQGRRDMCDYIDENCELYEK